MKTTKYYIEFENVCSQQIYSIQSRYFDTEKQAYNWYKKNIDFVADDTIVWLMQATFDENGELDEIASNGKNITRGSDNYE